MEFQYDPAAGEAVEVTRGGQKVINPDAPTQEEVSRYRLDQTAQGLADRGNHTETLGDAVEPESQQLEVRLQQVQQQLYRGGLNPLEEQQLIRQAEAIASQLAGGAGPVNNKENTTEPEDFNQAYRNANPGVDQDLKFAAEVMGEELAGEFNSLISSDDELTKTAALDTLHNLRESPGSFISKEDSTGVDDFTHSEIASQYGLEMANDIKTLGDAVANGVISPSQAIATAAKDPALQQALFTLAQQGTIRIAL
jgi:hypothetical protein